MFEKIKKYLEQLVEDWNTRQCKKKIRKCIENNDFNYTVCGYVPVSDYGDTCRNCNTTDNNENNKRKIGMRRLIGIFGKKKKFKVDYVDLLDYAGRLQYNKLHSRPILEGVKKKLKFKTEEERTKEMKLKFPVSKDTSKIPNEKKVYMEYRNEVCLHERINTDMFIDALMRNMPVEQQNAIMSAAKTVGSITSKKSYQRNKGKKKIVSGNVAKSR